MINQNIINKLYNTLSNDLSISKFNNEFDYSYKCRLVYSALAKWILTLFSDRDFESEDNGQISKSHVTISAINILNSYKKIDPQLKDYFNDDKKLVNLIENVYIRTGYVDSGTYSFKSPQKLGRIKISNKCLVINADSKTKTTRGLGLWGKPSDLDTPLDEYLLIKDKAEDYASQMISQLQYSSFDSNHGKLELYNIEKNRWELYSSKLANRFNYSIVRIDDGMDYKIIKRINEEIYGASLPIIYSKSNDYYFEHEVWRIILGICALNGIKAKCYLTIKENYLKIKFGGFILPSLEDAILRCMCWPLNDCLNISEFITDISMKNAVIDLLSKFSIEIVEVK